MCASSQANEPLEEQFVQLHVGQTMSWQMDWEICISEILSNI